MRSWRNPLALVSLVLCVAASTFADRSTYAQVRSDQLPAPSTETRTPAGATASESDILGDYALPLVGGFKIVKVGSRLFLREPNIEYGLDPLGGNRYTLGPPAKPGTVATFRPATVAVGGYELHVKHPAGEIVHTKLGSAAVRPEIAEYQDLVGSYFNSDVSKRSTPDGRLEIANIAGHIALIVSNQPAFPLRPAGRDVLHMVGLNPPGAFLISLRRDGGVVSGFTLKQPNVTYEYLAGKGPETGPGVVTTAEQVRQGLMKALGGEAALKSRRTLIEIGEIEMQSLAVRGSARTSWRAPNLYTSQVTMVGPDGKKSTSRTIYDGRRGRTYEDRKSKAITQPEVDWQMIESPQEPLQWNRLYKSVRLVGQKTCEDAECFVVEKITVGGATFHSSYSTTTFLPVMTEGENTLEGKKAPQTVIYRDWRVVDGVRRSFTQQGKIGGISLVIQLTSAQWNAPIADSVFLVK